MANTENLTKAGQNWGNKGGTGRPPNELRAASRDGYAAVLALIEKWVGECHANPDSIGEKIANLLQALEKLGKYGLGEQKATTPEELINAFVDACKECEVEDELYRRLASAIDRRLK